MAGENLLFKILKTISSKGAYPYEVLLNPDFKVIGPYIIENELVEVYDLSDGVWHKLEALKKSNDLKANTQIDLQCRLTAKGQELLKHLEKKQDL